MGKEADKDDERKEAAIASTAALRPNYKPKNITQHQLSKFQELHRRRLQIKSKSKIEKKPKGRKGKSHGQDLNARDSENQESIRTIENSTVFNSESHKNESSSLVQQEDIATQAPKKRQKLHWGKGGKGKQTCRYCHADDIWGPEWRRFENCIKFVSDFRRCPSGCLT